LVERPDLNQPFETSALEAGRRNVGVSDDLGNPSIIESLIWLILCLRKRPRDSAFTGSGENNDVCDGDGQPGAGPVE
jgi:hypothetical protein